MFDGGLVSAALAFCSDSFVLVGALVTLAVVCTLLLLAKSRYSINQMEQAHTISGNGDTSKTCLDCCESKLSCRMIYNRLFGPKIGPLNKASCTKCGSSLPIGGQFNGQKQFNSYGKVKVGRLESSQSVLGGSFLSEPSEFSLSCEPTTTTLEMGHADEQEQRLEPGRPLASVGQTNSSALATFKGSQCSGIGFDPDTVSAATLTSGSSLDEQPAEQLRVAQQLDAGRLEASNHSTARKDGSYHVALEGSAINKEHNCCKIKNDELSQQHKRSSESGKPKMVNNGDTKFRWMKTMRKVWRTQHIAMLFRQASKQVSTLKQATSMNNTLMAGKCPASFYAASGGCDGSQDAQQAFSERSELGEQGEPELLSSKKLRSADIQIPMESFNDSNTSEFDCAGWDSRQDTSLEFVTLADGTPINEHNTTMMTLDSYSSQQQAGDNSGNSVMDADLRHSNRLNLELLVLQNATQNMMNGAYGHRASFASRSKSLGAGGSSFPQSGILPTASEFSQLQELTGCGDNRLLQRQISGDVISAVSDSAKSRTSSEHDSGIADQLDCNWSRKSSLAAAATAAAASQTCLNAPFGLAPSIRLMIKPLQAAQQQVLVEHPAVADSMAADKTCNKRSILNTLAGYSIKRSASRCSANDGGVSEIGGQQAAYQQQSTLAEQQWQAGEQLFEVQLIELCNMLPANRRATSSGQLTGEHQWQSGGTVAAAGGSLRARCRRDSLLGALVAATMPTSPRRPSVEGVFARVFKHHNEPNAQSHESQNAKATGTQRDTAKRIKSDAALFDNVSVNSASSSCSSAITMASSTTTTTSNADYIQMPLVRTTMQPPNDTSSEQSQWPQAAAMAPISNPSARFSFMESPVASAYRFVCRKSEFPLRVSLYQVSKRGGARYTIGHCFVSLSDCTTPSLQRSPVIARTESSNINIISEQANQVKRLSSGSTPAYSGAELQSNCKFVILPNNNNNAKNAALNQQEQEQEQQQAVHLEYRLYQTILEAIP